MIIRREWAIPLALGLVVVAGLAAMPGDGKDADGTTPTPTSTSGPTSTAAQPILLPFEEGHGLPDTDLTFLVLARQGRAAAEARLNATGYPAMSDGLDWVGDRVGFFTGRTVEQGCRDVNGTFTCSDPAWAFVSPWLMPKPIQVRPEVAGPRVGIDGYNGTRATIYVFNEQGLLAATNDAAGNWSRFGGSPTTMESSVWYIGANQTAPNGTEHPPSFAGPLVQRLRPLIVGLPVGGVASTQSNAYVGLYGTLFITARIDAVVYAP